MARASGGASLADKAYAALRREILGGRLRPGMPLSRRRIARDLHMSIVPVAQALRRLEDDGLLESRARAGTRVRMPTDRDIRDLYELREALETQAARLFAERATLAQRRELRRRGEQMDLLFRRLWAKPNDPTLRFTVHRRHAALHLWIADHAGSPRLKEMIERNHVLILNWAFDVAGRRTPLPPRFHARLASALASADSRKADAAMRAHVRYGLREITGRVRALADAEWRETRAARRRPAAARVSRRVR
jgi:DNA-binding GntR family transcriptional regulator